MVPDLCFATYAAGCKQEKYRRQECPHFAPPAPCSHAAIVATARRLANCLRQRLLDSQLPLLVIQLAEVVAKEPSPQICVHRDIALPANRIADLRLII